MNKAMALWMSLQEGIHAKIEAFENKLQASRPLKAVLVFLIYGMLAYMAFHSWFVIPNFKPANNACFQVTVDQSPKAIRPFITRALVPFSLHALRPLIDEIPEADWRGVLETCWLFPSPDFLPPKEDFHSGSFVVFALLSWISIVLLGEGLRRLIKAVYKEGELRPMVAGGFAIILWPILVCYANYIYDPFTVTFVAWVFYAALRWPYWGLLLVLGFAALNRETSVLLPFAIAYYRLPTWPRKRLLWAFGAEFGLVFVLRSLITWYYSNHPGQLMDFHLIDHNIHFSMWRAFLPKMALIAFLLYAFCFRNWSAKPRLAQAMILPLFPLLALGSVYGYFDEIRQYSDVYPGAILLGYACFLPDSAVTKQA